MKAMNETEYLNACEYELHYMKLAHTNNTPIQFFSNFPHKYTTVISAIGFLEAYFHKSLLCP